MSIHKPVLLKEVIEVLNLKAGDIVVDATLGGGGHCRLIQECIGKQGVIVGIDADIKAIENFAEFPNSPALAGSRQGGDNFQFLPLQRDPAKAVANKLQIPIYKKENIYLVNSNFSKLSEILETLKIEKVDAILADLGWSSDQLEGRGMSFRKDEDLDMRLNKNQEISAKNIVNNYSEEELGRVIKEYGEEKFWKNIAKKIVEYRKSKKIETTIELAEIIKQGIPHRFRYGRINPTTKTFQALRIVVNKELENLEKFIPQAIETLTSGGRLAIITFHSLEDRIVKNMFRENARGCILTDEITGQSIVKVAPEARIINKKPIAADESEIAANPRARSAKLRVLEKV